MIKKFLNKLYTTPKYLIACCLTLVVIIVLIILVVKSRADDTPKTFKNDINVQTVQASIAGLDTITQPGNTVPLELLSTCDVDSGFNLQYIVTVWGKATEDIADLNIKQHDYIGRDSYIVLEDGNEISKKYYILENKSTVQASKYDESDGAIIAVRYYIDSKENMEEYSDNQYYILDKFDIGLAENAQELPRNSSIFVTVKTQATTYDVNLNNWTTVSDFSFSSSGNMGEPINLDLLSTQTAVQTTIVNDEPEVAETIDGTEVITEGTTAPVIEEDPITESATTEITTETVQTEATTTTQPPISETESTTTTTQTTTQEQTVAEDPRVFPESMSINTGYIGMTAGQTYQLTTTFTPTNTTETMVTWMSSNESVATVSSNGLVTGVGAGTATITVATINGMKLDCTVDVTAAATTTTTTATEAPVEVLPDGVYLDYESLSLNVGDVAYLQASVSPENVTNLYVEWYSTDATVASVVNGQINALSPGTTFIYVTTANGLNAVCTVYVS